MPASGAVLANTTARPLTNCGARKKKNAQCLQRNEREWQIRLDSMLNLSQIARKILGPIPPARQSNAWVLTCVRARRASANAEGGEKKCPLDSVLDGCQKTSELYECGTCLPIVVRPCRARTAELNKIEKSHNELNAHAALKSSRAEAIVVAPNPQNVVNTKD